MFQVRRRELRLHYGFDCTCPRCEHGLTCSLPGGVAELDIDTMLLATPPLSPAADAVITQADQLRRRAEALDEDGLTAERCLLEEARRLRASVLPAQHVSLYELDGQLLSSALLQGDYAAAHMHCRALVDFLRTALAHVPQHPLIGLQWYTLGDLELMLGRPKDAAQSLTHARDVIRVAHGAGSELGASIDDRLREINSRGPDAEAR